MTRRFGLVALALLTLYGVLFWSFASATRHGGLLTPEGAPSTGLLVLGLAVLLLRIVVLFVLLPVGAYRLSRRGDDPAQVGRHSEAESHRGRFRLGASGAAITRSLHATKSTRLHRRGLSPINYTWNYLAERCPASSFTPR